MPEKVKHEGEKAILARVERTMVVVVHRHGFFGGYNGLHIC